jgi:hypothetical protein
MTTCSDLTDEIKRTVVWAVMAGLKPDDALVALIAVAAWMIGEVPKANDRKAHLDHVLAMLPRAVAYVSAWREPFEAQKAALQ